MQPSFSKWEERLQGISGVAGTMVVKRNEEKLDTDLDIDICFDIFILLIFEKISPAVQVQTAQRKWHSHIYTCGSLDSSESYIHVNRPRIYPRPENNSQTWSTLLHNNNSLLDKLILTITPFQTDHWLLWYRNSFQFHFSFINDTSTV